MGLEPHDPSQCGCDIAGACGRSLKAPLGPPDVQQELKDLVISRHYRVREENIQRPGDSIVQRQRRGERGGLRGRG